MIAGCVPHFVNRHISQKSSWDFLYRYKNPIIVKIMGALVIVGIAIILTTIFFSMWIDNFVINSKNKDIAGVLFILLWIAFLGGLFLSDYIKNNF